jgi:hypothetical protein
MQGGVVRAVEYDGVLRRLAALTAKHLIYFESLVQEPERGLEVSCDVGVVDVRSWYCRPRPPTTPHPSAYTRIPHDLRSHVGIKTHTQVVVRG